MNFLSCIHIHGAFKGFRSSILKYLLAAHAHVESPIFFKTGTTRSGLRPKESNGEPFVQQPGTNKSSGDSKENSQQGTNRGYVNLPINPLEASSLLDDTLDRTKKWVVASRESLNQLTGPCLPPKPISFPQTNTPGIPYGYENVLPISQRYKNNPYSMLSTATGSTLETCSNMTSDDDASTVMLYDTG